jgi:hypothetical protein
MRLFRFVTRSVRVPAVRYPPDPRALFMLILCVVVGVPLSMGNVTPGSIADQMETPYIIAWGIMLSGGALLTLVGTARQTVNGVITEQVGSVALGFACLIYAGAIWGHVRWSGTVPMGIVCGLGLASGLRYFQLRAYLRDVEQLAHEIQLAEAREHRADELRERLPDERDES